MTIQESIIVATALAVIAASADVASAAPGDAFVGEWRSKDSLQIMSFQGSITLHTSGVEPITLDCGSETECRYETTMHSTTHYVVQDGRLLVQEVPKTEMRGFNPKKSHVAYKKVAPGIKPGRYKLNLTTEILSSKADGSRWDPMGDPPDPIVTATIYGAGKPRTIKCRQKDTLTSDCLNGTVIDVDMTTMIEFTLVDEDAVKNDKIGKIDRVWFANSANKPEKPISVTTSGQIKSATLSLTLAQ